MTSLLTLEHVGLVKNGRTILDHVDLKVAAGEIVTLIGPNGAGKSSLVKLALGLDQPTRGSIITQADLRIGYLPQRFAVDPSLPITVRRLLNLTTQSDESRLHAALDEAGVGHLMDDSVHTLSGGELQRVLLARVILREPHLMVLDEPTQNMDIAGAVECYQIIQRVRDKIGCGVLLVSHDLSIVMAATNRVYCLNGHVCCSGHPDDVSRDPEFLRLFGAAGAGTLALYKHDHDHEHAPDGHVVRGDHTHDHGHSHVHGHNHHKHGPH